MKKIVATLLFSGLFAGTAPSQPRMLEVKGGYFDMGFAPGDADENPVHQVFIEDFMLAETETTVAQFKAFIDSTDYRTDAETGDGSYIWDSLGWHKMTGIDWRFSETGNMRPRQDWNCPVVHISWNDAVRYCNWLSRQSGFEEVYNFKQDTVFFDPHANGYRLPTEAEWEYAAAGNDTRKPVFAGTGGLNGLGWYSGNAGRRVHPVAQKQANKAGIYDLSGNVWEWCNDWYAAGFYAKIQNTHNPAGPPAGETRVIRGGSWNNSGKHCRIANRTSRFPDFRDGSVGFRVARNTADR